MSVNNPEPAYFWDEATKSWRKAVVGEPGEYVWNNSTNSWVFGTVGAEYLYNHTTRSWEYGPGGQYVRNPSTNSWDLVRSPGYGGQYYWDDATGSWLKNAATSDVAEAFGRWDFINNQAWFAGDYVGALSNTPNWTFTRASTGYAQTSAGVLVPFASGELRRTDKGVLIEGSRQNLCLQSQTLGTTWVPTNGGTASLPVVTADYGVAPDGTTTADRVQFALNGGTATADRSYLLQSIAISTATAYTISFYAKSNGGSVAIGFGGDNIVGNTAATVTSEWQRFSVTATSSSTSTNLFIQLRGGQTPTQANSADLLIWGVQLEAGSFVSSYIPTTTASQTRAADSLSVTGVTGLDYPLSLFAQFSRAVDTGGFEQILRTLDAGETNSASLAVSSGDLFRYQTVSGGVADGDQTVAGAIAVGVTTRCAFRTTTNDVRGARAGTLGSQDVATTAIAAAPSKIVFGSSAGGSFSFGYLERAAIFPRALSDAELQAIST